MKRPSQTDLSLFSLADRNAVITGASRGIGHALAQGLAKAGARVLALARSASPMTPFSGMVEYRSCDVLDEVAFREACERFIATNHGHLDILVNNAGLSISASHTITEAQRFNQTLNMNLSVPYLCSLVAKELMPGTGGGAIINIGSLGSLLGMPNNPGYVAAKGGLLSLTRALALDWGSDGIRVNAIIPGYIRTSMTESSYQDPTRNACRTERTMLGRWGMPDDLVGTAIFLASDAARYITGQQITVDGGWTAKGLSPDKPCAN